MERKKPNTNATAKALEEIAKQLEAQNELLKIIANILAERKD